MNPTSPLGQGGLGWYIWFQPSSFQPFWFQPLWEGIYPLPLPPPRAPRGWCHGSLGPLVATFLPSWRPSFFHRFFDAFFDRFWFDFGSQVGSQNPPKSLKNRCQDALYFALYFLIDFLSIFAPNLDLLDLKKRGFSFGKIRFFENTAFEVNIDF